MGCLDVGLIHEPPITRTVPSEAGRIREQGPEPLHPPTVITSAGNWKPAKADRDTRTERQRVESLTDPS
jgi:hypothetical protein